MNSRESVLRRSKPGRSLYVRVQADPGSQCNVLTVDQSVLLMKSGNDITPAKVRHTFKASTRLCSICFSFLIISRFRFSDLRCDVL